MDSFARLLECVQGKPLMIGFIGHSILSGGVFCATVHLMRRCQIIFALKTRALASEKKLEYKNNDVLSGYEEYIGEVDFNFTVSGCSSFCSVIITP